MPKGELFLRSRLTRQLSSGSDGLIDLNSAGKPSWVSDGGWVDAFERYGLSLEKAGHSTLKKLPTMKQPVGSSQAGTSGVAYDGSTIGVYDERILGVDFHIVASSKEAYEQLFARLESEVLACGYLQLRIKSRNKYFHLIYQDCSTYEEFNGEMSLFTLSFLEPHPEITDRRTPNIM